MSERDQIKAERAALADAIEEQIPGFIWDRDHGWPRFGGGMPWQGDGTWQGKPCYLRFRHNQASMTTYVDEDRRDEVEAAVIWPYFPDGHPDAHEHPGFLADDQVAPFIQALIEQLAPVSDDNPSSAMLLGRAVDAMLAAMRQVDER